MTLKEIQIADLAVIYNTDEFAVSATYKGGEIPVRFENDYEVEAISNKVISTPTSGVLNIKLGDNFVIDGINYKCINLDHLKTFKTMIVITKIWDYLKQ